ncbi:50S ribosomal protein L1 [Candidatus Burarchaeum australiense]|nr:50S ribosomal protein L1 [Candidatus Burarchaeum australiense]
MAIEIGKFTEAFNAVLAEKGKRKFTQTAELMINFSSIDFNKQDNRLNLELALPKGRGKEMKIAVFADGGQVALDAKNAGFDVIGSEEIAKLGADRPKLKALAKTHEFLAEPKLMMVVGKSLGQFLGTRDKLPRPLVGSGSQMAALADKARRNVRIKSKGKYLPVAQCAVGNENMSAADLAENAYTVYEAIRNKVGGDFFIKSVMVKLSMGKPVKVG